MSNKYIPDGITIEKIKIKSAQRIAGHKMASDPYHQAISKASRVLVDTLRGSWIYLTQWSSGSTVWESPLGTKCTVTWEGEIKD